MGQIKKFFILCSVIFGSVVFAKESFTIQFHSDYSNAENESLLVHELHENAGAGQFILDFNHFDSQYLVKVSGNRRAKTAEENYWKVYPNGDFYFLIGNLDEDWSESDYARFYSIARWLSQKGFRTILIVTAYEENLAEAVSNPKTSAIIWNSHGFNNGVILDARNNEISKNIFINNHPQNLKLVFFANCFGAQSAEYYQTRKITDLYTLGWDREVTSNDLFDYLISDKFDSHLEKIFNKKL